MTRRIVHCEYRKYVRSVVIFDRSPLGDLDGSAEHEEFLNDSTTMFNLWKRCDCSEVVTEELEKPATGGGPFVAAHCIPLVMEVVKSLWAGVLSYIPWFLVL